MNRLNNQTHPELKQMRLGMVTLEWSHHATLRAADKGLNIDSVLLIVKGSVVELETDHRGKVTKLVIRNAGPDDWDYVHVIVPVTRTHWKVVTAWKNHKDDNHSTLNKERMSA